MVYTSTIIMTLHLSSGITGIPGILLYLVYRTKYCFNDAPNVERPAGSALESTPYFKIIKRVARPAP